MKKLFWFLFLSITILNILDFIVTYIGISNYGFVVEGNPNIVFMVKNFGWIITGLIKILGTPILLFQVNRVLNYTKNNKYVTVKHFNIISCFTYSVLMFTLIMLIIVIYEWLVFLIG